MQQRFSQLYNEIRPIINNQHKKQSQNLPKKKKIIIQMLKPQKSASKLPGLSSNTSSSTPTYMAKVILLGNSSVGKTSILTRYTWSGHGTYQLSHTPTIGVDFKSKTISLPRSQSNPSAATLKYMLWDTAGQQRFRTLTDNYYSGVSGIVLVYSVTDRKSYDQISQWMFQIASKTDEDTVKIILGNKCDVSGRNSVGSGSGAEEKRVVEAHEGKILAQKYNAMFMEVSAKENINIQQAFLMLGTKIVQKLGRSKNQNGAKSNVLVLQKKKQQNGQKSNIKNCCS